MNKPKIIPAVARLDAKPSKPRRVAQLKQHRAVKAWKKRAADEPNRKGENRE